MRVERSVVICRPVEKVFAFVTDMHNVTRWTPACEIRQVGQGPMAVGARFVQVGEILGRRIEATTEVTEYAPPDAFAFKTVSGPIPLRNTFRFFNVSEGTRVEIVGEGEPGSLFKLAGPLFNVAIRKQIETQLEKLKNILEGCG
jgi:uncharacterized membrane protein